MSWTEAEVQAAARELVDECERHLRVQAAEREAEEADVRAAMERMTPERRAEIEEAVARITPAYVRARLHELLVREHGRCPGCPGCPQGGTGEGTGPAARPGED